MCNACGNVCCGSDMFGKCGCDGCPVSDCWDDDLDEEDDDILGVYDPSLAVGCACVGRELKIICEATP